MHRPSVSWNTGESCICPVCLQTVYTQYLKMLKMCILSFRPSIHPCLQPSISLSSLKHAHTQHPCLFIIVFQHGGWCIITYLQRANLWHRPRVHYEVGELLTQIWLSLERAAWYWGRGCRLSYIKKADSTSVGLRLNIRAEIFDQVLDELLEKSIILKGWGHYAGTALFIKLQPNETHHIQRSLADPIWLNHSFLNIFKHVQLMKKLSDKNWSPKRSREKPHSSSAQPQIYKNHSRVIT